MIHINTKKIKEKNRENLLTFIPRCTILPMDKLYKLHYLVKETQFLGCSHINN